MAVVEGQERPSRHVERPGWREGPHRGGRQQSGIRRSPHETLQAERPPDAVATINCHREAG